MASYTLDALGLKCPQPILKVAVKAKELQAGDMLEVLSDCESFPQDIVSWDTVLEEASRKLDKEKGQHE
jgi:tRNA 2-thiouridine synthesizing protein A